MVGNWSRRKTEVKRLKIKIRFWLRFAGFVNYQQEQFWEHSGPDMSTALGL